MIFGSNPNLPVRYGASFKSSTPLASNTPETIFTPASNVRGAVVWIAGFTSYTAGAAAVFLKQVIVAKSSAPVSAIDGDVIVMGTMQAAGGTVGALSRPVFIPAGRGLYYITESSESGAMRSVLYDLL